MNIPNEYMKNSVGHLVPIESVADIDKLRDQTVKGIVQKAETLQQKMREFKSLAMSDIQTFIEISAEKYGAEIGGKKGNVTLSTYSGDYKLVRQVSEYITFDERLQVAKELIDECIIEWSTGARSEIRALVQDAFQTNKQGHINTGRVLGLRRLEISDEKWQRAMQAIADSIQVSGSKEYVRLYKRLGQGDQYEAVSLDIATL